MTEQKRGMDPSLVETLYPDLKGLYIPRRGEIIHWGTGNAIVVQSPLDTSEPLMAVSLNGGIHGPFEVSNHSGMGPHEAIPFEAQQGLIVYYDNNYRKRFSALFLLFPEAYEAWNFYRDSQINASASLPKDTIQTP